MVRRHADTLTIGLDLRRVCLPTDQLVAIVTEVLAAGHAEIAGFEFHQRAGEHAEFQVSPIDGHDGYVAPMSTCDDFPPAQRNPREVQRTLGLWPASTMRNRVLRVSRWRNTQAIACSRAVSVLVDVV